jgi:hypothetical protein
MKENYLRYSFCKFRALLEWLFLPKKQIIKIKFSNFADIDKNFFITPLLKIFNQQQMKLREVKYLRPDLEFFSVFGSKNILLNSQSLHKVFFTGENIENNSLFADLRGYDKNFTKHLDLSLGFNLKPTSGNYNRLPLWLLYYFSPDDTKDIIIQKLQKFKNNYPKPKFCAMVARYDVKNNLRTKMYQTVSQIDQVDCAGKLLHNDDSLWQKYADNKTAYLQQYKFNICPENSIGNGYVTEKLFQALYSGCIPIYHGYSKNPEPDIINPHIFLWFDPQTDNQELLRKVSRLHKSAAIYKEFRRQDIFLDTAVDKIYDYLRIYCEKIEKLARKICR